MTESPKLWAKTILSRKPTIEELNDLCQMMRKCVHKTDQNVKTDLIEYEHRVRPGHFHTPFEHFVREIMKMNIPLQKKIHAIHQRIQEEDDK